MSDHNGRQNEKQGIALGLFAMACFSAGDGIWKHCLGHISVSALLCVNSGFSILVIAIYAWLTRAPVRPRNWLHVAIFVGFYIFEQLTFIYALGRLPMAELFVIILTTPLFVLVAARIVLNEKLSLFQTLSVVSGFAGTLVVIAARMPGLVSAGHQNSIAVYGALASALANVVIGGSKILFMRRYCRDENGFGLSLALCGAFFVGGGVIAGPGLMHISPPILAWLAVCGTLSAAGLIAYVGASQKARAPLMAATQYSQMVWAMLLGVLVFREPLSLAAIAGAGLIVLSGALLYGPLGARAKA